MKREIFPAVNKKTEPQAGKEKNPHTDFCGKRSLILVFEVGENTQVKNNCKIMWDIYKQRCGKFLHLHKLMEAS